MARTVSTATHEARGMFPLHPFPLALRFNRKTQAHGKGRGEVGGMHTFGGWGARISAESAPAALHVPVVEFSLLLLLLLLLPPAGVLPEDPLSTTNLVRC